MTRIVVVFCRPWLDLLDIRSRRRSGADDGSIAEIEAGFPARVNGR